MNSTGIRACLFALSLCVGPTSLLAQLPFSDMSYAQNISTKAYLCPPEVISSLFAQPDAKHEAVFAGRIIFPIHRLYIFLSMQNNGLLCWP